jgi:hypothetical protein
MAKTKLMTQKEFAEHIGKTPQYVNKLVTQGKIVLVNKKVDLKQAQESLAMYKRHGKVLADGNAAGAGRKKGKTKEKKTAKAPKPPKVPKERTPAKGTITFERLRRERADADKAELMAEKLRASLLPKQEVLLAQQRQNSNVREKFRGIARLLAVQLAQATSPSEVETLLLQEIDAVLAKLSEDPLGMIEVTDEAAPLQTFAGADSSVGVGAGI